jgi:hypothetical protein
MNILIKALSLLRVTPRENISDTRLVSLYVDRSRAIQSLQATDRAISDYRYQKSRKRPTIL